MAYGAQILPERNLGHIILDQFGVPISSTNPLSVSVSGVAADGAAVSGNPILVAGQDGTNAQSLLVDSTGRQVVVGAAADGAAVAGNPVLIAGQDGTNAQSLLVDTLGRQTTKPSADILIATPTLSVAGAYVSGDYIGQSTTPQSFTNGSLVAGLTSRIVHLTIIDKSASAAFACELWLFDRTITVPTDNAAWAISDADALFCQAIIPIATTDWYASSNNHVAVVRNVNALVKPNATALFYALVSRGTPTLANGDLQLDLAIEQN